MNLKAKRHSIDTLFSFLLLLIFALFTLMLAGMGSAIYRSGVEHLNENYTSRTAIAYLSEKVRQHDSTDHIFLTTVEELPAIAFRDIINDTSYLTYVYYCDGALQELFVSEDTTPLTAMGTRIIELSSFEIEKISPPGESTGQIISVTAVSEEENQMSILLHLCSQ